MCYFSCIAFDRFWKIHKQEIHLRKFKIIREAQFIFNISFSKAVVGFAKFFASQIDYFDSCLAFEVI